MLLDRGVIAIRWSPTTFRESRYDALSNVNMTARLRERYTTRKIPLVSITKTREASIGVGNIDR
jgi:hypothetical protein